MNISDRLKKCDEWKSLEKELGVYPIPSRFGEFDIAYPASDEEYCALGGYSIAAIMVFAQDQEELPIERAYFQTSSEKIFPLGKIGVCVDNCYLADRTKETKDDRGNVYFENISFWAIPTGFFMDPGGLIAVDFKGERKAFVLGRGPWKTDNRVLVHVQNHLAELEEISKHVQCDSIMKFIEREFISNNRVQL